MEPRRVLITGACGTIGTVLRPALREGVEELRLSDLYEPEGLVAPETYVARRPDGLRRRPARGRRRRRRRAPRRGAQRGRRSRSSPARTCTASSTSSRRAGAPTCSASSTPAPTTRPGMYPVGVPLDGSERAAAGRPLRRVEGLRRGARAHVRRPLRAVDRLPADRLLPAASRASSASSPPGSATPTGSGSSRPR